MTDSDICRRVIQRLEEIIDQGGKLPDGVQRKIMLTGPRTPAITPCHRCNCPPCCWLCPVLGPIAEPACCT